MSHGIYYVLENRVPSLAKNEIYQTLMKEIIPTNQTYHVNDIWSDENLIEFLPIDQGKTIRVDEVEKKGKKIEYSCCINGKRDTSYQATSAISEGEGTNLVYSYIEIHNLKSHDYFNATTVTISKEENNQYILSSSTSDNNAEIDMVAPSYSVDEFIEKVSPQTKIVKQKNRKDG